MNWVIVMAAGNGIRMQSKVNKAFLPLFSKPVAFYTLKTLEDIKLIDKVLIVIRPTDRQLWQKNINQYNFKKIVCLLPGQKTRQAGVEKALEWLKKEAKPKDLIGIHNVVNPFAEPGKIKEVFSAAKEYGAAVLAVPAKDTIKIAEENKIITHTPLRQFVWHAQTPQVSSFDFLLKAFQQAKEDNFQGTDDSQLLERAGIEVKIVPCPSENFKITYPQDLYTAEKILWQKKNKEI